jgi:hypothetical protein
MAKIRNAEDLKANKVVRTPISRLNNQTRTKKLTPTTLRNNINKYFSWCETEDRLPSLTGLAIFLKVARNTVYVWMSDPRMGTVVDDARMRIQSWCEEDVYKTPGIMVPGKALYMKNVHNWSEKQQTDINQEVIVKKVLTLEEAKGKLESLAPLLLEQLKGSLLSQLSLPSNPKVIDCQEIIQDIAGE